MEGVDHRKLSVKESLENYIYNMKFYFDFSGIKLIHTIEDRVYILGKIY